MQDYKHQQEAVARFSDQAIAALFCETGTGKARMTIRIIERKPEIRTVFLFCKKNLIHTWANIELPKHSTDLFNAVPWKHNEITKVWKEKYMFSVKSHDRLWVILNYAAAITDLFKSISRDVLTRRPVPYAVICDESTEIKNIASVRTKKIIEFGEKASFKAILSGTPAPQSPEDYFSQAEFLIPEMRLLGASSIYGFRNQYAETFKMKLGNRSFTKVKGYRNLEALEGRLSKFAQVTMLKDCVDMPERVSKIVDIPLTPVQKKHYDNLSEIAFTKLDSGEEYSVTTGMALLNALNQICCGQLKLPTGEYTEIQTDRIEALLEQLDELGDAKALIWVPYVFAGRTLAKAIGDRAVHVKSEDNMNVRTEKVISWRQPTGPKYIISHPALMGHGETLNEAKASIYYGRPNSLEQRLQSMARNFRIGQEDKTQLIDMMALKSLEKNIFDRHVELKQLSQAVLTGVQLRTFIERGQDDD